jgi:hypothetical protein
MKRTAPDRTAYQPKPVERVELDEKNTKARITLVILAIVIAVIAFAYALGSSTGVDHGWREIEADGAKGMTCAQDFQFNYYLGGSGISAAAELKAITNLYTQAAQTAYYAFNTQEAGQETNNLFYLNRNVNTPVQVDAALYQAFEKVNALGSRYVFLAPVYAEYHNLFFCTQDWETAGFDPHQNADIREYAAQVAAFARDPGHVRIDLMGENTLQLTASEEYLAFARENGIVNLVDFYWMKDAFIIDYLAQVMEENGYNRGAISSYDGFVRCLSADQLGYSFHAYDLLAGATVCKAARLNYSGGTSLVHLHDFPLNKLKEIYFYQFADGTVRTPYVDLADGLDKAALPALIGTSRSVGCAEMLMRLMPFYAADALDAEGLHGLRAQGVYPLYCMEKSIVSTSPDVTLDEVFEGYHVTSIAE